MIPTIAKSNMLKTLNIIYNRFKLIQELKEPQFHHHKNKLNGMVFSTTLMAKDSSQMETQLMEPTTTIKAIYYKT
jgi:hypothetical protein